MRLSISEILEIVGKAGSKAEKIELLRKHDGPVLRTILKYALDPHIEFDLPEGEPPYNPCTYVGQETMLYQEARRLYLFTKNGNPNISNLKRESLFIQMLEVLDPKDAKLICAVKDKKIPYRGITIGTVSEAFPGLFELEKTPAQ
jgi:Family of unknown function (DUF6433)